MKNKILYILPIFYLFFVSCNNETKNNYINDDITYFGGNIINPTDSIVTIIDLEDQSDTIIAKLDENNFFLVRIDSLSKNTYTFQHGDEFQYFYIEKHDSIMIRFNTLEFDESLVFSGRGASVNNYLIKRYLNNEENSIDLIKLFSLDFDSFNSTIDSIKIVEHTLLNEYNYSGSDFSEKALLWVNNMLKYTEYKFKELYPYNNAIIKNKNKLTEVDSSFYNYRVKLNLNDSTLYGNSYFKTFVNSRIFSMSLDSIFRANPDYKLGENDKEFDFELNRIKAYYILKTFKDETIKNYLFYRYSKSVFNQELNIDDLQKQLIPFFENVTDKKNIKHINHLLSRYKKLAPGSKALDFEVYDGKKQFMLSKYFGKPIYLFFWLNEERYTLNKDLTKSYNELKKQYPNIQFISIYLDYPETWKSNMRSCGANGIQLKADYKTIRNKYMIPSSNSFVLIDKHGKIVESNTSWPTSNKIKEKLNKLK